MRKYIGLILLIAFVVLSVTACSLNNTVHVNESFNNTFSPVAKTMTVPPTATTVTLTGTASVNSTNTLFIFVNEPDGTVNPESITGDGSSSTQNISASWPAQPGTWTLRVSAVGASGNFSLTLQY